MPKSTVDRILLLAKKNKLSASALCKQAGLGSAAFSKWKTLRNRYPSIDALVAISDTFGVSLDWLVTGNGEMYLNQQVAACETCEPSAIEIKEMEKLRQELAETKQQVAALQSKLGELKGRNADLSAQLIESLKELLTRQNKLEAQTT